MMTVSGESWRVSPMSDPPPPPPRRPCCWPYAIAGSVAAAALAAPSVRRNDRRDTPLRLQFSNFIGFSPGTQSFGLRWGVCCGYGLHHVYVYIQQLRGKTKTRAARRGSERSVISLRYRDTTDADGSKKRRRTQTRKM